MVFKWRFWVILAVIGIFVTPYAFALVGYVLGIMQWVLGLMQWLCYAIYHALDYFGFSRGILAIGHIGGQL